MNNFLQAKKYFLEGNVFLESNNFLQAEISFIKSLELIPNRASTLINLSATQLKLRKYSEAEANAKKAITIESRNSEAHLNLGLIEKEYKRYEIAANYFDKAISLKPNYYEAWSNKGLTLYELKYFDEALTCYDKAITLEPDYYEAWSNKGVTLHEIKRYNDALTHYDKAISLKPDYAEGWSNKGNTLHKLKRYNDALTHYDKAISLKPNYYQAWSNKGVTLYELKHFDEALTYYDEAISLKPDFHETYLNKSITLIALRRFGEALICCDKALSFKIDYLEAWCNKGVTFHELKRFDEALICYDKALSFKIDYLEAWRNKGVTLYELKRLDEALYYYEKALHLQPNLDWTYGDLIYIKLQICNWSDLVDSIETISKNIKISKKVTQPFSLLALTDNPILHKKSSEIFIENKSPSNNFLGPISKHLQSSKIRLGYFSSDFYNHATSYLIAELFELHDKSQFEVFAFSFGPITNDEIRQRLNKSFDQFIEVGAKSDVDIAKLSRDLNINIALDLKGFTQDSRTSVFAYRAAPIQVNYLGYPSTMGADYIDYIIADKTLIPEQFQLHYSEKVVYLPNSYQVNDRKRLISDKKFTREELGLPQEGFIFCCFNNNYKILPATFKGWMRILKAVDGSILWLLQDNSWVVENLIKEAKKEGISGERLVFAERLPLSEHLARHRQADLFLDTLPINAHTTASDALWSGLPVLTLIGNSFASRVAASLLNAIGLPELITSTQEEYEALAIELANSSQRLADLKKKLANNRLTTPLFNTPLFTKNLEAAYIQMYQRYRAGLEPDHILINSQLS